MPLLPHDGLSPKHQAFVREYLIDLNATAAYKRAGYKDTPAAEHNAARLMGNDKVKAAIDEALAKAAEHSAATTERLEQELERIALADVRNLFAADGSLKTPDQWSDADAAAIAGLECHEEFSGKGEDRAMSGQLKKVKCWDKRAAIVDLLKRRDAAKAPPPLPPPGSTPENPLHVSNTHSIAPAALRSFIGDLRKAGIVGKDVDHEPADNASCGL